MKQALRISVGCLFIALLLNAMFCFAQGLAPGAVYPGDVTWLRISTHNPPSISTIKPEWTVVITSARPTVKQLAPNRWEISFSP